MLIQELIQIVENKEDGQGVWGVMLHTKAGKMKGWYVSDDEDLTDDASMAYKYKSKEEAEADAEANNDQWDLNPGEAFKAAKLDTHK